MSINQQPLPHANGLDKLLNPLPHMLYLEHCIIFYE